MILSRGRSILVKIIENSRTWQELLKIGRIHSPNSFVMGNWIYLSYNGNDTTLGQMTTEV
jgi:hypothetical protein